MNVLTEERQTERVTCRETSLLKNAEDLRKEREREGGFATSKSAEFFFTYLSATYVVFLISHSRGKESQPGYENLHSFLTFFSQLTYVPSVLTPLIKTIYLSHCTHVIE